MSLALQMKVNSDLQSGGNPEIRRQETWTAFHVLETGTGNRFIERATLPLARVYQEVLRMVPEGMLEIDRHQELMVGISKGFVAG